MSWTKRMIEERWPDQLRPEPEGEGMPKPLPVLRLVTVEVQRFSPEAQDFIRRHTGTEAHVEPRSPHPEKDSEA